MKSEFEQKAANAAVEAAERRWQHAQDEKRRQRRNQTLKNLAAISFLLLGLGGGGLLAAWHAGMLNSADLSSLFAPVTQFFSDSGVSKEHVESFARQMRVFTSPNVKFLSELPDALRPKKAAVGSTYHALCAMGKNDVELFELTIQPGGRFDVAVLSPFSPPRPIDTAAFQSRIGKRAWLLEVAGKVYLCKSHNHQDATALQARITK